ncbi:TolC family protein [Sphingomonas radiodurans]|uniref:TolC family protein n=1 Tax=Sphingomonas radiodurans TaxID=2890321 RepID=UPI001E47BADA|nr:TolC family protein [Sphingomonas radiodurans]WBH15321.1 TolC family protein [Sphingomonas radiodurans]
MIRYTISMGLALCVLAAPARAQQLDERPDLPPPAMVTTALDEHPSVLAAGARVTAAQAQAGALTKGAHEFTVTGSAIRRSVDREGSYKEFDATVSRPFRLPGKAALDRKTGTAGIAAAQNRMADARHQAALELSRLWFDWIGAGATADTDASNVANLERALAAVRRRAQLRDASTLDVEQAQSALSRARGQHADSRALMAEAQARLRATYPTILLSVAPPQPGIPAEPTVSFPALGRLVIERSHEIAAAQADADRLGFAAQRARADRIADPSLGIRAFSERSGMERGLGMVATMPLGGGYRRLVAAEAVAQAGAAVQEVVAVRRSVEATAAADVALAQARLDSWNAVREAASSAESVAARTLSGNRLGAIELGDLLYAQRQANDARREEVRARVEALRAILKLEIDSHVVWIDTDDHDA